jgi:hypothetical protein
MALGKPGIPTLRQLDVRSAQGIFDALRRRIEALEAVLTQTELIAKVSSNAGSTTNASISNLQTQITALKKQVEALSGVASGEVKSFTAVTDLAIGDAATARTVGVALIDPTDGFAVQAPVGVCASAASAGGSVQVRIFGSMAVLQTGLVPGLAVYAAVGGGLTQTPPDAGFSVPLGVATGDSQIFVAPGWPAVQLINMFAPFDEAMPPTLGLVRTLLDDSVRDEILEVFEDTEIPRDVRLVIVSAIDTNVTLTMPSGLIEYPDLRTAELTIYRRDTGSGTPGDVFVLPQPGELIDGMYELTLVDFDRLSFLAIGSEGHIIV